MGEMKKTVETKHGHVSSEYAEKSYSEYCRWCQSFRCAQPLSFPAWLETLNMIIVDN